MEQRQWRRKRRGKERVRVTDWKKKFYKSQTTGVEESWRDSELTWNIKPFQKYHNGPIIMQQPRSLHCFLLLSLAPPLATRSVTGTAITTQNTPGSDKYLFCQL